MQKFFETPFDILYLIFVISIGIAMICKSRGNRFFRLYGIMAVVLGAGDSFHLIPRVLALCTTGFASYTVPLGLGKLITSITMTIFYILLYHLWCMRYQSEGRKKLTFWVYGLAVLRIILCLFPQNDWTSANPPLSWAIYRNIPFALLGLIIIVLFYQSAWKKKDSPFRWMWLAITLSFAFYIPVVLWAEVYPLVGMLMIPKTVAYVWIVLMGWNAMRHSEKKTTRKIRRT